MSFPTIKPPGFPIRVEDFLPVHEDSFEANYIQLLRKANRSRRIWTLDWNQTVLLTQSDFTLLRNHYIANRGVWFSWTHPYEDEYGVYTVAYKDKLVYQQEVKDTANNIIYYSSTVILMEQ